MGIITLTRHPRNGGQNAGEYPQTSSGGYVSLFHRNECNRHDVNCIDLSIEVNVGKIHNYGKIMQV